MLAALNVLLVPLAANGSSVSSTAAGGWHTCAVTAGGAVQCCGLNQYGQLGDGTTTDRAAPVGVSGLTAGVASVITGASHTCALTSAGAVLCWGYNDFCQLGDGTSIHRPTPVPVIGLTSGVVALSAGSARTCAVTSEGAVLCWGYNRFGQVGDGTTSLRTAPVPVSGLTGRVVTVTAGHEHTCAVTSEGAVQCWGFNAFGQLGPFAASDWSTPVSVGGLPSGVVAVAAGYGYTCALTSGGAVWCWGINDAGQLGNGPGMGSPCPVRSAG